ncbi:MBL fold metallo-hydrolase [Ferroplasma sp.]|uniref:MBL fold metallo-hydrolase n=1 Tax=Ferroplasma sp. TaxID=2591003 RepID=UPI00307E59F3
MKFKAIGTWSSKLDIGKKNSSFLLEDNTLLDCGPHAVEELINSGINLKDIKAVLVTHLHLDHYGGIPELIWQRALNGITDPVNIIGPEKIENSTISILKYYNTPEFMLEGVKFNNPDNRVTVAPGIHTVEDYTYRIKIENKKLFYSGDTSYSETAIKNGENCDIFIHEATYCNNKEDEAKKYGHSTVNDALKAFTLSRSKILVPTHMSADSLNQIKSLNYENILIPEDGKVYYL